ncbi:MAG: hypothetical protein ACLGSA_12710 [Acidobacteriota bacterium]
MNTAAKLTVMDGGKAARNRTTAEEREALRADTVAKLKALGVLDQVKEYASRKGWGKPEVWTPKNCLKLTKYGRDVAGVNLCGCGEVARHFDEDGFVQCDACHELDESLGETLKDAITMEVNGSRVTVQVVTEPAPAVSLYFRDEFILDRESWVFPYAREVALWEICLKARAEADRYRALLALKQEEMDTVLGPLAAITSDPEYRATMDDIIFLVNLDHGRPVRDFHDKAKTLMVDAFNRDEPKYKGAVKLVFKVGYDAKPSDNQGASYSVEVKEDTPPFVSGGRLYHDKKGNLLKSDELYQALPLGQAGNDAQARA